MEHRWGERLSVRERVALRASHGSQGIGYLLDVSISGALLVSGVRAEPWSIVRVSLAGRSSLHAMSIEGQVVRQTANGFALEWCELAPEIVRSLLLPAASTIPAHEERDIPTIVRDMTAARRR